VKHQHNMYTILRETDIQGTFAEALELQSFPFDCQDLSMFMVWPEDKSHIRICPDWALSDFVQIKRQFMVLDDWELHPPVVEFTDQKNETVDDKSMGHKNELYPGLLIRLKVERVWRPYIFQIYLVMSVIWLCSLVAFMSDPINNSGDRISQATTMVLTVVAFQFLVSEMLPKLSYLTVTDVYMLGCTFFISSILIQVGLLTWVVSHFYTPCPETTNSTSTCTVIYDLDTDNWVLGTNFFIYVVFHLVFVIYVYVFVLPSEKWKLNKCTSELQGIETVEKPDIFVDCRIAEQIVQHKDMNVIYRKVPSTDYPDTHLTAQKVINKEVEFPDGTFWSKDFGHHTGKEFFATYLRLWHNAPDKDKAVSLCLRKLTGDNEVAAGKLAVHTHNIPENVGDTVDAYMLAANDQLIPIKISFPTKMGESYAGKQVFDFNKIEGYYEGQKKWTWRRSVVKSEAVSMDAEEEQENL